MARRLEDLYELLAACKTLPVLFVGSGVSRRYIGSPDWDGLLEVFADRAGKKLPYYMGQADSDRPKVASLIASDFYDLWWNTNEYERSRSAHQADVATKADPLKIEVAKYIDGLSYVADEAMSDELKEFAGARVHAVITTNWDSIVEQVFPDFEVYVGQQDVLFAATYGVGEIYKIHGSCEKPSSLVLTQEDYAEYWDRNPYLIAKVLTLFVEHPIIFLGYSISDPHIQKLMFNLVSCLTEEQLNVLNDRLFFVGRPGLARPEGISRSTMTVGSHTFGIQVVGTDDFGAVYHTLSRLPQHYPTKFLRQLRESVYELAYAADPAGRVYVLPFNADEDLDRVEVVIGVGMMDELGLGKQGYKQYSRRDLFEDMLRGERRHDPKGLLSDLVPDIFKQAKYGPVFYPLYLAGRLDEMGNPDTVEGLPARAVALVSGETIAPYPGTKDAARRAQMTFRALVGEDPRAAENLGVAMSLDLDDMLALRDFLRDRLSSSPTVPTSVAKLACKFDYIVYGPGWTADRDELHAALGIAEM